MSTRSLPILLVVSLLCALSAPLASRLQSRARASERLAAFGVAGDRDDEICDLGAHVGRVLAERHLENAVPACPPDRVVGADEPGQDRLAEAAEPVHADGDGLQHAFRVEEHRLERRQLGPWNVVSIGGRRLQRTAAAGFVFAVERDESLRGQFVELRIEVEGQAVDVVVGRLVMPERAELLLERLEAAPIVGRGGVLRHLP